MATTITSLGNKMPLALTLGGLGAAITASNGGIFYSTASVGALLAGTATANQILQSGASAAPTWSTATYPATTTINQLLYSSAANVIGGLATANSGTLVTSSTGVPSILALGAQQSLVGIASGTPAVAYIPGLNRVLNGDFQVWQRGAGGSASFAVSASTTVYTADRWQVSVGASTATTVAQTAGATSGSYLCKVQRNSGQTGTAVMYLCTSLTRDMCVGAAGNVVTLSFQAAAGINFSPTSGNITVTVYSGTGSTDISGRNGAFTGTASPISSTQAITTTLTSYSFTSSTLGSTVTQLAVQFSWTPVGTAGTSDWVEFTNVQLEVSANQTPFQQRTFVNELLECQRFYYKTFLYGTAPVQNAGVGTGEIAGYVSLAGATTNFMPNIRFPIQMLAAPTITTYSPAAATAQIYNESASAAFTATTVFHSTATDQVVYGTGSSGGTVGQAIGLHITADVDVT